MASSSTSRYRALMSFASQVGAASRHAQRLLAEADDEDGRVLEFFLSRRCSSRASRTASPATSAGGSADTSTRFTTDMPTSSTTTCSTCRCSASCPTYSHGSDSFFLSGCVLEGAFSEYERQAGALQLGAFWCNASTSAARCGRPCLPSASMHERLQSHRIILQCPLLLPARRGWRCRQRLRLRCQLLRDACGALLGCAGPTGYFVCGCIPPPRKLRAMRRSLPTYLSRVARWFALLLGPMQPPLWR
mmetsp:Transcript_122696/g.381991  ORF Transcript_122696/g.381991 Transcript_122696/m.381991 type:complete len:247 (-) Transcript_122696:305-1045(-)